MNIKQLISIILSLHLIMNNLIAASIEVDTNAAAKNQASLRNAQNGVQIVDIVNPNSKGISHNKFKNFNVVKQGVILNNSRVITKTQLAGYISDNQKLKNNANLILNEVTSTNRSLLEGYTEVAGKTADVIIANPNGISVNGGGFINANNVTLTTGKPNFAGDFLNGFDIARGDIAIEGEGFNANNIDRVNLYSKALALNAKIYANSLNVVTGENFIDTNGNVTSKNAIGSGISIDSSLLGGIYANTISLVSNDNGVGVNLPPEVIAQDSLSLDANGKITLQKTKASNSLFVNSKTDSIQIDDSLYSKNLTLKAADTISTKDSTDVNIIAEDTLNIEAKKLENKASIYTGYDENLESANTNSTSNINVDILDNNGFIVGNDLTIKSKDITNNGAFYSKNNINIEASNLDNNEMIRSNNDINLFIENTLNNKGMIYSDGDLTIAANEAHDKKNTINNTSIMQSEKDINLYAFALNNKATIPNVTSSSTSSTTKSGGGNNYDLITKTITTQEIDLSSIDPAMILAQGNINIDVNTLNNLYSLISSNQDIVLNANTVNNVGKVLIQTTKITTKMYRDERYCSSKGPSGSCFNHKNRAAYRGTKTSTKTEKTPFMNFGIQATNSITGNVVTLNNLSDQLAGALADSEISTKLNQVNMIDMNSVDLQSLTDTLTQSNTATIDIVTNTEDIDTLASKVTTEEELVSFKDSLNTLKDNLKTNIENDQTTISSLEAVLVYIKTQSEANVSSSDITSIETTIQSLKDNLAKNVDYINDFEIINNEIVLIEDVGLRKDELKDINTNMQDTFLANTDLLNDLNSNTYIDNVVSSLETKANTLRNEVNVALELKDNIEYKIVNNKEGLYQINTTTSMQDIASLEKRIDATVTDLSIITQSTIEIPKNKFGSYIKIEDIEHKYLIEVNPLYIDYKTFISSDYMIGKLNLNPEKIMKRLGDGSYETNLVKNVVIKATGKRYLDGFTSDKQQFQALMDNAIDLQTDLNLEFGISLSKEQVALLSKDIVWMEEQVVDGQTVLVPQVYIATNRTDTNGVKLQSNDINLAVKNLINEGYIVADNDLNIQSENNITNQNGKIASGNDLQLVAQNDIENISGTIQSGSNLTLQAANDINISTSKQAVSNAHQGGVENLTKIGESSKIVAGNDLTLDAKNINITNGELKAENTLALNSSENTTINSLEQKSDYNFDFGNGYSKGAKLVNRKSSLEAKNIDVNANNLTIKSSDLKADENVDLSGVNDVSVLANNDYEQSDMQITTSSGFIGKKTQRDASYKESVVSSNITGKNINMTSTQGDITLEAAKLKADENIIADAKGNINVVAKQYKEGELHQTNKSSWWGLKKSVSLDKFDNLNLKEAKLQTEALNVILKSGNDINIIASDINSAADVQLEAFNKLMIAAGEQIQQKESLRKKTSFNLGALLTLGFSNASIYTQEINQNKNYDTKIKESNITAGNNFTADTGSTQIIGSNIEAQKDINITSDINSVEIVSAQELSKASKLNKKVDVKLNNIFEMATSLIDQSNSMIKSATNPNSDEQNTKIKINIAKATYDKDEVSSTATKNISSNLVSKEGSINVNSSENVHVKGSNLAAKEDINLTAQTGNVTIEEAVDTKSVDEKNKHAQAEVNLTVQNEYVEIGTAVKAAIESAKQLKKVKDDYSNYKKQVKTLEGTLSKLKQDLRNKVVGVDAQDIEDIQEIVDNAKDDERYYLAAIAAATADLASKTVAIAKQSATAASSSGTWGFSAGISLDLQGSKTTSNAQETKSLASNLNANNITIKTNKDLDTNVTLSGSNAIAQNEINIDTKDLTLKASADTSNSKSDTKDISGSVSMTMYSATGPTVNLGYGEQHYDSDSVTYNNTQVNANNVNINVANDANIAGANVNAEDTLNLTVGNDLNIESKRNATNSNSNGFNLSAGFGFGADKGTEKNFLQTGNGKVTSANASYGANTGRTKIKQTVLSSVTGDKVNVTTGNNTNLKGSLLAAGSYDANGNFIDNGNLDLTTKTLTYSNSTDSVYNSGNSFSVGTSIGFTKDAKDPSPNNTKTKINSTNLAFSNSLGYQRAKTLATLGTGNVTITDTNNSDDTTALNRDTQNISKTMVNTSYGVSVDATLDHRLLTEDGRKQIAEDFVKTGMIVDTINQIATNKTVGIGSFFKEVEKLNTTYEAIKAKIVQDETLSKLLNSPAYTDEQKHAILNSVTQEVMVKLGYNPVVTNLIATTEPGRDGKQVEGYFSLQTNSSFVNDLYNYNNEKLIAAAGTESQRAMDAQDGSTFNQSQEYRDDRSLYSKYFGNTVKDYTNFALGYTGQGSLSTQTNSLSNVEQVTTTPSIFNSSTANNNIVFASLDKNKGDNLCVNSMDCYGSKAQLAFNNTLQIAANHNLGNYVLINRVDKTTGDTKFYQLYNPDTKNIINLKSEELNNLEYLAQANPNAFKNIMAVNEMTSNTTHTASNAVFGLNDNGYLSGVADSWKQYATSGEFLLDIIPGGVAAKLEGGIAKAEVKNWIDVNGNIKWPKNDGFLNTPKETTLSVGMKIDRYGYTGGTFVSPKGVPYEQRSLAPGTETKPYNVYEIIKPIDVLEGEIAPWFNQIGGGTQYKLNKTVQELLDENYIKEINK